MKISLVWPLSPNFGDALAPWLCEKLIGPALYANANADYQHYIIGGSILNWANKHSCVWGAGIATITDGVNPEAQIRSVRGPITRARALTCGAACPPVYGDPALLLPRWVKGTSDKRHDIGVVPHYVDQYRVTHALKWPDVKIINVLDSVENVVREITSCERIVSSSLHGLVVAHAYGIPAAWAKFSDSVGGDGTKFRDHYASVGLDVATPTDMRDGAWRAPQWTCPANLDTERLWNARPGPEGLQPA